MNRQPWDHNFVGIAPLIMKFGTGLTFDVFYTIDNKKVCEATAIT